MTIALADARRLATLSGDSVLGSYRDEIYAAAAAAAGSEYTPHVDDVVVADAQTDRDWALIWRGGRLLALDVDDRWAVDITDAALAALA